MSDINPILASFPHLFWLETETTRLPAGCAGRLGHLEEAWCLESRSAAFLSCLGRSFWRLAGRIENQIERFALMLGRHAIAVTINCLHGQTEFLQLATQM